MVLSYYKPFLRQMQHERAKNGKKPASDRAAAMRRPGVSRKYGPIAAIMKESS